MPLVHKSVSVRAEVWKKLRIDAELSGVSLRDFLTYLIEGGRAVAVGETDIQNRLNNIARQNAAARSGSSESD